MGKFGGATGLIATALLAIGGGSAALLKLDKGDAGIGAHAAVSMREQTSAGDAANAAAAAAAAAGTQNIAPIIPAPSSIDAPAGAQGPETPAPQPAPQPSPAGRPQIAIATPKAAGGQPFVIKRILPISGPIRYGEWHWDEAGVPAGPIVITVDLQARVLSAFRSGYEIGTAAVLVGAPAKPTPTGVFPITQKQVTHFSNLYGEAPMPYMQRLTNDGVTLHASHVMNGYASHGCVGLPMEFARKLYGVTHLGDKVIITSGKRANLGDKLIGN